MSSAPPVRLPPVPGVEDVPLPAVVDAVRAEGERLAGVLRAAATLSASVPGLRWSVADVAAHLTAQAVRYAQFARGERDPLDDVAPGSDARGREVVAAVNDLLIDQWLEHDPGKAADALENGVATLAAALLLGDPRRPVSSWEATTDVAGVAATCLSELVVHGVDVRRALRCAAVVDEARAAIAVRAVFRLMPAYVRPERLPARSVTVRVAVRGGTGVDVITGDGGISVRARSGRPDCVLSGRASTLLLLAHRRTSVLAAVRGGGVVAFGRRPQLGLRFLGWFEAP